MREERIGHVLVEERVGWDEVECYSFWAFVLAVSFPFLWNTGMEGGIREEECGETYIFIASNCSFLGIISSMYGASRG